MAYVKCFTVELICHINGYCLYMVYYDQEPQFTVFTYPGQEFPIR